MNIDILHNIKNMHQELKKMKYDVMNFEIESARLREPNSIAVVAENMGKTISNLEIELNQIEEKLKGELT